MDTIKDFTNNGNCSCCGGCCSNRLPLTPMEVKKIKNYIKIHKIKEVKNSIPSPSVVLDMTCPFLNVNKKCNIYKVRPKICKIFKCDIDVFTDEFKKEFRNNNSSIILMRDIFYKRS